MKTTATVVLARGELGHFQYGLNVDGEYFGHMPPQMVSIAEVAMPAE